MNPGRSSAWLERPLWEREVAGSNPVAPTRPQNLRTRPSFNYRRTQQREDHGRKAEPHPREAHHLGDAGGAEAQHHPRLRAHRRAGQHPRLPQGQGSAAHHRPARRQGRRARARGQRGPRRVLPRRPSTRTTCVRSVAPRPTSPSGRTRRTSPATCCSPSRSTCAPRSTLPDYNDLKITVDAAEVTDDDVDEELDTPAQPLRHARHRRPPRQDRRLRPDRPRRHHRRRRGRHGQQHLLRDRLRRAHRGHRRGTRLADRR